MAFNDTVVAVDYAANKLSEVLTPIATDMWHMYRTQMVIEGYVSIIYSLAMLIGAYIIYTKVKWIFVNDKLGGYASVEYEMGFAMGIVAVFVLCLLGIPMLADGLMHIANPDYYVVKELLGALK